MGKELTYILGAGASFQSIPIVKSFNSRLSKFSLYLNDRETQKTNLKERYRKFTRAINVFNSLIQEFGAHQSFDTYFKKFFHFGNEEKINQGKRLLHLYFLWEHSVSSLNYNNEIKDGDFTKQSLFDKRYDALIAGLLKPVAAKSEPICNLNFITWNYDINLLNSIKNFFYSKLTFAKFLQEIRQDEFIWNIDNKIKIINVNGYFYSSKFNSSTDLIGLNIDDIIDEKIENNYFDESSVDEDADKIRFAWELNEKDENNLKRSLSELIDKSDDIIIIGYTFPVYNRFIDLGYLKQDFVAKKSIVIQDPNADILKQTLNDVYRLNGKSKINTISNCDSFYLPSSIFGINEYRIPFGVSVA